MQPALNDHSKPPPPHGLSRTYNLAVILILLALLPFLMRGVLGALRSNTNDPRQWLPRGFHETITYRWLQDHFGNDEITIVSWPGCTLEDPRAARLAEACIRDPDTAFFQRAITGAEMVHNLTSRRVPYQEAIRRLQGVLVGRDAKTSCVMLTISDKGAADRATAVDEIRRLAGQECSLDPAELRMGGPTVDAATIDVESQRMLLELAGLSGIIALTLTWLRLRSMRIAIIILMVSVYSTAIALSLLYYTGGSMNLVMTMLPPLVFVLSVSAAIHLVNYYRDALQQPTEQPTPMSAPLQALRDGWRPCLLASATTAVGLLSLAVSEIVPVKMFGIYAAAGMCGSLATVIFMLPVLLTIWPESKATPGKMDTSDKGAEERLNRFVDWLCRHDKAIVITCLVLMVGAGLGLFLLRSTVKLQYRFGEDSRILQDYRWLEDNLGPLVPLELVVHFKDTTGSDIVRQLKKVRELEDKIRAIPDVGATLSGADFIPDLRTGGSVRYIANRRLVLNNAALIKQKLEEYGFRAEGDEQDKLWRISVRASALSDIDYGRFVDKLREDIDPLVENDDDVKVTYTGVIPLIYKAQRELLSDLVESFLLAFGVIALVMIVVLRDIRSGLLTMIPNVFPAVIIFGLMGWCRIWIEIGSIMTASAAMGIAVDDTFHLLTWYRRGLQNAKRRGAIHYALRRCAGAMVHTTLVCSCALLVFSLSTFMPIRRFSWLMAALLVAALLGDTILLPAILSTPLGRVVRASVARSQTSNVGA
jgi:predicted RND superfamily exporter protein